MYIYIYIYIYIACQSINKGKIFLGQDFFSHFFHEYFCEIEIYFCFKLFQRLSPPSLSLSLSLSLCEFFSFSNFVFHFLLQFFFFFFLYFFSRVI